MADDISEQPAIPALRDCDLCRAPIATGTCMHVLIADARVTMSRVAWERQVAELVRLRNLEASINDGEAATPAGPRTWALPDEPGPEITAVHDRAGRLWKRINDPEPWRQVSEHLVQHHATWYGLLAYSPLSDATPAETGRAPARIDGAGRTGAGAGDRVDDAETITDGHAQEGTHP